MYIPFTKMFFLLIKVTFDMYTLTWIQLRKEPLFLEDNILIVCFLLFFKSFRWSACEWFCYLSQRKARKLIHLQLN